MTIDPLPNRECGACNACCEHVYVDSPEFSKAPGHLCEQWKTGVGCSIHATRPAICRGFFCGWRLFDAFDDSWRPDLSGLIIMGAEEDIPAGYPPVGVTFLMFNSDLAVSRPAFHAAIKSAVAERLPIFLAWRGPPGHHPARMLLNRVLEIAVRDNDEAGYQTLLATIIRQVKDDDFLPVEFRNKILK